MQLYQDNHLRSYRSFRLTKPPAQQKRLACRNDFNGYNLYTVGMALPKHDWFLKEWLATLGKKQSDIVKDMDWNKARVSLMISGKQQYTRDAINELALYLNLKPHELLMHPHDAMSLRKLQSTAIEIAHAVDEGDMRNGTTG